MLVRSEKEMVQGTKEDQYDDQRGARRANLHSNMVQKQDFRIACIRASRPVCKSIVVCGIGDIEMFRLIKLYHSSIESKYFLIL